MAKSVRVPGLYDYFHIDSAKVNIVKNEKNIPEHILAVNFSTGVASRQLKALFQHGNYQSIDLKMAEDKNTLDDEQYRLNDEELKKYKKIKLKATEAALSYQKVHFFKAHSFEADTFIYVKVKKGIKSGSGIEFVEDYTATS